ncbi:hypothetical protein RRF57_010248 [Xylaria bambusicola]|uniref:Uncharacterized protein n=1 Tax=Xylaria bambusicola TaxID=326684 RepID=A0AAN7Z2J7_9PEZI
MTPSANSNNPAASELRRRHVDEPNSDNSSPPHAHAGNDDSLHQNDPDGKGFRAEGVRKTYGRTRDGKGEQRAPSTRPDSRGTSD